MKQNFNNFPLYTKINSVYIHIIEGGNEVAASRHARGGLLSTRRIARSAAHCAAAGLINYPPARRSDFAAGKA